jgi:hypothetical protein
LPEICRCTSESMPRACLLASREAHASYKAICLAA